MVGWLVRRLFFLLLFLLLFLTPVTTGYTTLTLTSTGEISATEGL